MDFALSDDQSAIERAARDLLADRFPLERVQEIVDDGGSPADVWSEISQLGWPGIAIAEQHGGQGLGVLELALLCERLGYSIAPVPFLSNAAAAAVLAAAGSAEQAARWLPGSASGEARLALGFATPGTDTEVLDGEDAAAIVLVDVGGARLIDANHFAAVSRPVLDLTRGCVAVSGTSNAQSLEGDLDTGLDIAGVACAADLLGIGTRSMELAVDYARDREQFGKPIGTYQAVSHTCAKMAFDLEGVRALTRYAAWCADADADRLPLAATMAAARAAETVPRIANDALQVMGGIGFTWEHPIHLLVRRAYTSAKSAEDSMADRRCVASLIGLPEKGQM